WLAAQHRADARLVEDAHGRIEGVEAMEQRRVDAPEALVVGQEERAAALLLPGPGHCRQAGNGMHGRGAIARAGAAEAGTDEALARGSVEPRETDDGICGKPGDLRGPLRRA